MSNQIWDHVSALSKQTLANIEAVVETLGDATGERVLLIGSAGFIAGTLETQVDAITDRALSRGVVINALDAKGLFSEEAGKAEREAMSGPGQGLTGQGPASIMTARDEAENLGDKLATATAGMAQLARGTGGEFITNNNDLAGGVQRLAGVPETVYLLTFLPRRFKKDGSFHRIQVKVNTRTPHSVQARSGYFAVKRAAIEPPARQQIQASTAGPTELPKSEAAGPASTNPAVSMAASTPAMTTAPASVNTAGQAASATTPAKGDESQPPAATPAAEPGPATEMETPPPDYSAEVEGEFVAAARDQVAKYITSFADLTAPETRKFEVFDEHGFPAKARTMQSALVVYRLQTESAITLEYRDIEEVDGHAVKDHEERAVKMWQNLTNAGSAAAEEKLIYHESERFDLGVAETGFTLYEGLALNPKCAGDFVLHEGGREQRDGREVRVFAYQQVKPCDFIQYNFEMPEVFRGSPLLQSGRLWVDARSAQIVQDEREVKVEGGKGREWRVAHVLLRYGRSEFGLMVPVSITFELYYPDVKFGQVFRVPMRARLTQNYGPFSRFEVTVGQKVKVPEH